jgi:hypothetical protein
VDEFIGAHLIHTLDDYIRDGIITEQQTDTFRRTGGCPESGHDRQPCGDLTTEPLPA